MDTDDDKLRLPLCIQQDHVSVPGSKAKDDIGEVSADFPVASVKYRAAPSTEHCVSKTYEKTAIEKPGQFYTNTRGKMSLQCTCYIIALGLLENSQIRPVFRLSWSAPHGNYRAAPASAIITSKVYCFASSQGITLTYNSILLLSLRFKKGIHLSLYDCFLITGSLVIPHGWVNISSQFLFSWVSLKMFYEVFN